MLQVLLQFVDIIIFIVLMALGYFVGCIAEQRHYHSIRRREWQLKGILTFANRFPPDGATVLSGKSSLVAGSVVVSEDYFKRILGSLYSIFGGRVKSYESLLDRARREAVLRMKAEAAASGARMIINIKFQTFAVPGRSGKIGAIELLAYGTALGPSSAVPA